MTGPNRSSEYACAIIMQDEKVLLGRRAHFRASYPNCWDFVGEKSKSEKRLSRLLSVN